METDRYRVLAKVVELGSFSKAAAALGYTQSAISQSVASTEAALGFRLVVRDRGGVRLTPEGRAVFPSIESVVNAQRIVEEKASEVLGLERGTVRMGTIASVSEHWLPAVIAEFQKKWPQVEFIIHQGDYDSIPEWIRTGKVDFGFVNPASVSGLKTEPIAHGEMLAILPASHRLADSEKVPLGELVGEPFILLEEGGYYEPLEAFRAEGLEPDIRFTIHDDFTIMAMVEQGLGVSILAELVMRKCPWEVVARPCDPPVVRAIALAWRDDASVPIASRRFMDAVLASRAGADA